MLYLLGCRERENPPQPTLPLPAHTAIRPVWLVALCTSLSRSDIRLARKAGKLQVLSYWRLSKQRPSYRHGELGVLRQQRFVNCGLTAPFWCPHPYLLSKFPMKTQTRSEFTAPSTWHIDGNSTIFPQSVFVEKGKSDYEGINFEQTTNV